MNFKLFAELGLQYPPAVDHAALARRAGLAAFQLREKTSQPPLPARHGLLDVPAYPKQEIRDKVSAFPPALNVAFTGVGLCRCSLRSGKPCGA